jgi:MFS family permease
MRDLLAIRDFRLLFVGQAMSNWGDGLTTITLLILTQRLTGSVSAVAGTAIAVALPQLLLGMLAGVYVDRWDRRKVMIVSDIARGLLVVGFVFVGSADRLWLLYGIAFLQAAVGTFFNPAKGALIPRVVGSGNLLAANSMMETSRVVFSLLGTAAAGVWAGVGDVLWPIFVADAIAGGTVLRRTEPSTGGDGVRDSCRHVESHPRRDPRRRRCADVRHRGGERTPGSVRRR